MAKKQTVYPNRKKITNPITGEVKDVRAHSKTELDLKIEEQKRAWNYVRSDMKVRDWSEEWRKRYVYPKVNLKTAKDIDSRLDNFVLPVIGGIEIGKVMPAHCQIVMDKTSGYSMDRINKIYNTMFQLFAQAQANWMIGRNPAMGVTKPQAENGQGRPFSREERHYFLKVCRTHEMGDWGLTMLYCGLRPGETARVRWKHLQDGGIYVDGTKTKNAKRRVPVPDMLYCLLESRRGKPDDYVFKWHGNKLTQNGTTRAWHSIRREMQIIAGTRVYRNELMEPYVIDNEIIGYCCRHTFATELKDATMPFTLMQELLGHSTGTITDTYLHSTETSFRVAKRILDKHRSKRHPYRIRGLKAGNHKWPRGRIGGRITNIR